MKSIKKIAKYLLILLLSLIVILLLAGIVIQTSMFQNWLKHKLVQMAESNLDASIEIGSLHGNLLNAVEIESLSVKTDTVTFLNIPRLSVAYSPLSILAGQIVVRELYLDRPQLVLAQDRDRAWNWENLLIADTTDTAATDTAGLGYDIIISRIRLDSGQIAIRAIEDTGGVKIPEAVKDLQIDMGLAFLAAGPMSFELNQFSFETIRPSFKLQMGESSLDVSDEGLDTDKLRVETKRSAIDAELKIDGFAEPELEFSVEAKPLSLVEVRRAFKDLRLYGHPRVSLDLEGELDNLVSKLEIEFDEGKIELWSRLQIQNEPYGYHLECTFAEIDLARITRLEQLASDLNFALEVRGRGTEWGRMDAAFSAEVDTGFAQGYVFDSIRFDGVVVGDSLKISGTVEAPSVQGVLDGFLAASAADTTYNLNSQVRRLNLTQLSDSLQIPSDLNFDLSLNGSGLSANTLAANLSLSVQPSTIDRLSIDSGEARMAYQTDRIRIDRLDFDSPAARLEANGQLGGGALDGIDFRFVSPDLSPLAAEAGVDSLSGRGEISGRLSGTFESMQLRSNVKLEEVQMPDMVLPAFSGELQASFGETAPAFQLTGEAVDLTYAEVDSLNAGLTASFADSLLDFELRANQGSLASIRADGGLQILSFGYRLILNEMGVSVRDQVWQKTGPPTEVDILPNEINVPELVLASGDQVIALVGGFDARGEREMSLLVDSLDIAKIGAMFEPPITLDGRLNFRTSLSGSFEQPEIDGDLELVDGGYLQESLDDFAGRFSYVDNRWRWLFSFVDSTKDSVLVFRGRLPYRLSFSPFLNELPEDQQVTFRLDASQFDLSFLRAFSVGIDRFQGRLMADLTLENTLQDLRGRGTIRITDGLLDIPQLGSVYHDITIALRLDDKEIAIDAFEIESGDGNLTIVDGSLSLTEQELETFAARLQAQNFTVMNSRELEAALSGQIELSGSIQALVFGGDVTVTRGRVYYPAYIEEETAVALTDRPFFVISDDSTEFDPQGAIRFQQGMATTETPFIETEFYRAIRGNLSLTFDRNTWLRGEEANIEVEGTLELQKQGVDFIYFGTLSVVRGYYDVQGNRFNIESGTLTFAGDPEVDPELDIVAVHEFVDRSEGDKIEREIRARITGSKVAPKFEFTLDGQEVEQKDVFSILLFGKPFDQLALGQRNSVAESSSLEDKAAGFLTSQLIQRLGGQLGSELNLDVLQIESGENLGDTKVRVGKYVTPDVFVSVSQDFGAEGEQEVELEYELPQKILFFNLFIEASQEKKGDTALDFIWKVDW